MDPMNVQQATRVVLLHKNHPHHHKVVQLVTRMAEETVALDLETTGAALNDVIGDCDLIVVEAFGRVTPAQWQALDAIRNECYVPVVMLTNAEWEDRLVSGLNAGADAVIPLTMAAEVILAHCRALVRRWRSHPYATPRFA